MPLFIIAFCPSGSITTIIGELRTCLKRHSCYTTCYKRKVHLGHTCGLSIIWCSCSGSDGIINTEYVWCYGVLPRVAAFVWLVGRDKVLTLDNLQKQGMELPNICIMCMVYLQNG